MTSTCGARSTLRSTVPRSSSSREDRRSASRPARSCPPASRVTRPTARYTHARRGAAMDRSRHGGSASARGRVRASRRACHRLGAGLPRGGGTLFREGPRELGFRLRSGCCPSTTRTSPAAAATGFTGWLADYLAASSFIKTAFTCPRGASTTSPGSATRAATQDRPRGGHAARECRRRLGRRRPPRHRSRPVVPLTRRRSAVLVSTRAGNVKTHALWFTLLDQMWVR